MYLIIQELQDKYTILINYNLLTYTELHVNWWEQ